MNYLMPCILLSLAMSNGSVEAMDNQNDILDSHSPHSLSITDIKMQNLKEYTYLIDRMFQTIQGDYIPEFFVHDIGVELHNNLLNYKLSDGKNGKDALCDLINNPDTIKELFDYDTNKNNKIIYALWVMKFYPEHTSSNHMNMYFEKSEWSHVKNHSNVDSYITLHWMEPNNLGLNN